MGSTSSSRLLMASGGTPPGTPTSFSLANSTTTPKTTVMSWSAPTTPATTLTGYKIYRDGSLIATQTGTSYTDSGLAYNTAYTYQVYAYNIFGNSPTPASGSVTTYAACSNTTGSVANGGSSTVTVPAGCFRVRIRALSGGGGGGGFYNVHQTSCFNGSSGGGGGSYINGVVSVVPGSTFNAFSGSGGSAGGGTGGSSGISSCYMTGGQGGSLSNYSTADGGAAGVVGAAPAGASISYGSPGYANTDSTNPFDGGNSALAGTNPTGLYTHGYGANQTCSRCQGCNGPSASGYGGGGAGGTDSGTLYGEASFAGGAGAPGYVVWTFSES